MCYIFDFKKLKYFYNCMLSHSHQTDYRITNILKMALEPKKNSNMLLMTTVGNECVDLECDICYKKINKKFFQCGTPCGKVFHTGCIEKMLEQSNEVAYESDEEPNFRCCYCRRDINIDNYVLQLIAQHLIELSRCSHNVLNALKRVEFLIQNNEKLHEDESFEYYEFRDNAFIKKPKQPKRQKLNMRIRMPRQIRIKQNIGGRRR